MTAPISADKAKVLVGQDCSSTDQRSEMIPTELKLAAAKKPAMNLKGTSKPRLWERAHGIWQMARISRETE